MSALEEIDDRLYVLERERARLRREHDELAAELLEDAARLRQSLRSIIEKTTP